MLLLHHQPLHGNARRLHAINLLVYFIGFIAIETIFLIPIFNMVHNGKAKFNQMSKRQ